MLKTQDDDIQHGLCFVPWAVLTGASFLNLRYLQLYHDQPQEVHVMVEELQNREDITMNFVVAAYLTAVSPGGIGLVEPVDIGDRWKDPSNVHNVSRYGPKFVQQRS